MEITAILVFLLVFTTFCFNSLQHHELSPYGQPLHESAKVRFTEEL